MTALFIILIIIALIVAYHIGVSTCLFNVIRMEERENKKIKDILDEK